MHTYCTLFHFPLICYENDFQSRDDRNGYLPLKLAELSSLKLRTTLEIWSMRPSISYFCTRVARCRFGATMKDSKHLEFGLWLVTIPVCLLWVSSPIESVPRSLENGLESIWYFRSAYLLGMRSDLFINHLIRLWLYVRVTNLFECSIQRRFKAFTTAWHH